MIFTSREKSQERFIIAVTLQIRKIAETEKSEHLPEIENLQERFLNISKTFEKGIKKLRPNVLI